MTMTISDEGKYVLLSIQPNYAEMILNGTKTVELRRNFPSVEKNQWVILYASSPVKAILGAFQIDFVVQEETRQLWRTVSELAGVTREEFDFYYSGTNSGYGIFINRTHRYDRPVPLSELRHSLSNFSPPQSFRYLDYKQAAQLNLLDFEPKNYPAKYKAECLCFNRYEFVSL